MPHNAFRVGVGRTDITPPIGTKIAGGLKPRDTNGVQTPLRSTAAVFDNGDAAIAIIGVDLCVLGKELIDPATALIQERTGIAADHIMVAASHTHAGPYTMPLFSTPDAPDPHYLALLPRYIADSATFAFENLQPAQIAAASGTEHTSGHYRRVQLEAGHVRNTWMRLAPEDVVGPVGEIDPELGVVLAKSSAGDVLSVVFNYSLHANRHDRGGMIDGSYPVRVAQRLEAELGGKTVYTPGACGNINPSRPVDEIASALAAEIKRVVAGIETTSDVRLYAKKQPLTLPLRDFSKLRIDAIRRDWPEGEDVFTEEWRCLHAAGHTEVLTSVQVLAINDTAFVGVPGELFVELGREIKQRSPFAHTYVVELANDYVGYIPTRVAFEQGGYEVLDARSSKVGPAAGEKIVEECVRLLSEAAG